MIHNFPERELQSSLSRGPWCRSELIRQVSPRDNRVATPTRGDVLFSHTCFDAEPELVQ
jgi:hypothetical protein